MKRKTYISLITIAVVLILTCLCTIGILSMKKGLKSNYDNHITVAGEYFEKADYKNAILEYEEALKINDKDEEAYIGIAQTYISQNDITQAIAYLRKGYEMTGSQRINKMLLQYEPFEDGPIPVNYTAEQVIANSAQVSINKDIFTVFRIYTYEQYNAAYELSADSTDKTIVYEGVPVKFTYSSAPSGNDKPSSIEATEISFLFNGLSTGVSYERLSEMGLFGLNFVSADSNNGRNMIEFDISGCHVQIETDENGNITSSAPWNAITFTGSTNEETDKNITAVDTQIDIDDPKPQEAGKIVLKGKAHNEAKGNAGGKVRIKIYSGSKPDKSMLVQDLSTTSEGKYRTEIDPGTYYVEALADKEVVFKDDLEIKDSDDLVVFDISYSYAEELRKGEIRVVLSWSDKNANLDHILEGENGDGNYAFCSHSPGDPGHHEHFDPESGELVVSSGPEVDGGPEEITVYDIDGTYQYYVDSFAGDPIAGAKVEVYTSDTSEPKVFTCPSDFSGSVWEVFTYKNGEVYAS